MRRLLCGLAVVAALGTAALAEDAGAGGGLEPGDVLGQENWQKAEALLPPEVLSHYQQGHYQNQIDILGFFSDKRTRPDGGEEWLWASNMGYQTAENIKMNRATVSGQLPPGKTPANDRRVKYDPSFYDFTTLQRFGK